MSTFIFLFLLLLFFTVQYCIGFAIHQHASAMGVLVFPILNPPPTSLPIASLWVIPHTSPEHPVSCIKPGLVIHFTYDIICFDTFSQIIPSSPCPTESIRLSIHLCLFCCLAYRVIATILLNSIYIYIYIYIYALVYCIGVFLSGLLHSV